MMMRASCEEKMEKEKKKMEVISIVHPTSSIAATNEWSQGNRESDFLPAQGGGGGGGGVLLRQMKTQRPPVLLPPQQDQGPLRCPRCDSSNTKFCYYNNYSLSQPRHLCKSCKRYWTRGGTLRNVPVGGGCRKNKRVKRPSPAGVTPAFISTTASRAGDGDAPVMFSYRDPQELDLSYTAPGFSSGIGGNGVGSLIPNFVMNSPSNSVVPGYGAGTSFLQTSSVNEIPPSMASLLLTSTIFQEQQKFTGGGGLGLKPSCPPENNVQVKFDEVAVDWSIPQQGQFDEIGTPYLSASCWNTFANGVGSWYHNESGNIAGSSIPSLI